MRSILITGAAGFLGRHFTKHHHYMDDMVYAIDDMSSPYAMWPKEFPTLHNEDAAKYFERGRGHKYDIVYHFAAPVGGREKIEGDPLFNADSLRLDVALFRWAAHAKPAIIVYPSSSAVYPVHLQSGDTGTALAESEFHPESMVWGRPDEMYGFTKMAGEYLAWKASQYGVNTLCIRPFSGYGEDQSEEYPMPSIARRIAEREDPLVIWGTGDQTRDFIHVDDVVKAVWARLKCRDVAGYESMNIGTGVPTSFREIAIMMAGIVEYGPMIMNDPSKPQGVQHRYCDPSKMLEYYQPEVSLAEGVKRMLRMHEVLASGVFI